MATSTSTAGSSSPAGFPATKTWLDEAEQAQKGGNAQLALQAYTKVIEAPSKDGNNRYFASCCSSFPP